MDIAEELRQMQTAYARSPMRNMRLPRPVWMSDQDPVAAVYRDKAALLQRGQVVCAHIVQANTILFKLFPHNDCPAHIIYSTSPAVEKDPSILRELAYFLYHYKDQPLEQVPQQWREIAQVITDEYDRSGFTFSLEINGEQITAHMIPVMVFRKLLPRRTLLGSFLPVLTYPESSTVLILPKRYWTANFKKSWCSRLI